MGCRTHDARQINSFNVQLIHRTSTWMPRTSFMTACRFYFRLYFVHAVSLLGETKAIHLHPCYHYSASNRTTKYTNPSRHAKGSQSITTLTTSQTTLLSRSKPGTPPTPPPCPPAPITSPQFHARGGFNSDPLSLIPNPYRPIPRSN